MSQIERRQKARKEHRCRSGCTINTGDYYWVLVAFPGVYSYPLGDGDYETDTVDFGWLKLCEKHYAEHYGYITEEEYEQIAREEEALINNDGAEFETTNTTRRQP